ncbi:collagenase [Salipaludibacillus sp. CUR1]|uniref:peptidase MA family metallohydrolase n=1 Tax=Salipaludibacillus sp. CUR1 TaxID=2820003 RepID=UPI001E367E49|nr:collagenase [Salipaludibacillus sp. CUR1]MCE7792324.1 collagenase [Salipaludibacillus sp. CUR1]
MYVDILISSEEDQDIQQEKKLKQGRKKATFNHITFYFSEKAEELMPLTKKTIERAMEKSNDLLGEYKERPVDIVLFENEEEFYKLTGEADTDGYYIDSEKLLAILPKDKKAVLDGEENYLFEFQSTIIHEYTHYAFRQKIEDMGINQKAIPIWFEEGLSEYAGNDKFVESDMTIVPFSYLTDKAGWEEAERKENMDVYGQSYLAVKYIAETNQEDVFLHILKETKKAEDFETGLYTAAGLKTEDIEEFLSENIQSVE